MQNEFAEMLRREVPPDDLLVNDFSDDMFDIGDYLSMLTPEDMDTSPQTSGTASALEQASQNADPFSGVGDFDSNWKVGSSEQPFSQSAAPTRPVGPVITTGALPVASEHPPTSLTQLPMQAPDAWSDFPAPAELPNMSGSSAPQNFSLSSHEQPHSSHIPRHEQPQRGDHDAVLKQVEEMLKGGNSPDVHARLMAIVAAQGRSAGNSGQPPRSQPAAAAPPHQTDYNAASQPASAAYASSLAGSYQSRLHPPSQTQAQQSSFAPARQLQPRTAAQMRQNPSLQAAADRLQSDPYARGFNPYAWPANTPVAGSLRHSAQPQQQQNQQLPAASTRPAQLPQHLPQQLAPDSFQLPDSILPQEKSRKADPQSNPPQARRGHQQARQTGAVSLQQQAQALLPRQEEPEPFKFGSYLPSSSAALPRGVNSEQPASVGQGSLEGWRLPDGPSSHMPDLQRASQGSSSGQDGSLNALTSPFASAAGSQSMTQALLEPLTFDPLPLDNPAAAFDLAPNAQNDNPCNNQAQAATAQGPASVPPVAGRLPSSQANAHMSNEPPNSLKLGSTGMNAAGGQLPSLEPLLLRPALPQRAPPPEDRATAVRNFLMGGSARRADTAAAAAAPRADIHPIFQGASQDSSGASCGLAASGGHSSQFSPVTSQVAASLPVVPPVNAQLGMQLPTIQPAAMAEASQDPALDQADDWAQFINLDEDADEDGQPQAEQANGTGDQQNGGGQANNGNVELNAQGKPKRKRKRDLHQQELNKQAQHRYRERKKAKAAELAQQVQLLSTKAANLQTAKVKRAHLLENNEALRKALEVKRAELAMAKAAARQNSPPAEPAPAEDTLADKVAVMEQKARSLAEQLHSKVFELDQHLKQSGLANKEHVPWDGGIANPAAAPVLDVIRRLVHDIHVITHEAHKLEGADVWDVVHRAVPPRQCPPGCHCLHCKDQDAWLDVADSLKLTDEQKCKIMLSRDHTYDTLRQVYDKRKALNVEAIRLMLPQSHGSMRGEEGLKQFAEMTFFSRARTTGKMSEVVDKLKSNLREEARADAVLDYIMFTKVLSPVQSAWFITKAYPLKFDCRALASAVYQIWSHLRAAPGALPQQPPQLHQQLPSRQQHAHIQQNQQQQQQHQAAHQTRSASPARRMEAAQAAAVPSMRDASPARRFDTLQAPQPGMVRQQQGLMRSHPMSNNLPSMPAQQHYPASQLPQRPQQPHAIQSLPGAQRMQQQRPAQAIGQLPLPQREQHAQLAQAVPQMPPAQRAQQLQSISNLANPSVAQQASQPSFTSSSLQQQMQELEKRHRQQFMRQRMGVPPGLVMANGPEGLQPSGQGLSNVPGQGLMGLGALQASDSMMAGAVPRPSGVRLPMAVP